MTRRTRAGVAEGAVVLLALALVPVALVAALDTPVDGSVAPLVDSLVAAAVLSWSVVTVGLGRLVVGHLRVGEVIGDAGPMGWAAVRVAALVLCVAPFLEHAPQASAAPRGGPQGLASPRGATVTLPLRDAMTHVADGLVTRLETADAVRPPSGDGPAAHEEVPLAADDLSTWRGRGAHASRRCRTAPSPPLPIGSSAVLVALAADVRRRSRLARRVVVDDERVLDVEVALLASPAPASPLTGVTRALAAAGRLDGCAHVVLRDGQAWLDDGGWQFDPSAPQRDARCLVVILGEDPDGTHVVLAPRGAVLELGGPGAVTLVDDAIRIGPSLGLGRPVRAGTTELLQALAVREDDDVIVCEGELVAVPTALRARCVVVGSAVAPFAEVGDTEVRLADGRILARASLAAGVRALLDGHHDRSFVPLDTAPDEGARLDDRGVVVRLLTAVPRVDGLASPLETNRERRAVELLAYLALRAGQPVTGERLRVRVLGTPSSDAAAKTLANVASCLRRSLGDGSFGPRLPAAGRAGHYGIAPDVGCDVAILEARVARARRCDEPEAKMAWLRGALELIESEPFETVLEGYDWFLAEGHVARLQAACEDAACELVELALDRGLVELAGFAIDRAMLVDPHAERLAAAAMRVAAARQASLEAIAPAARSTVPSAPALA